MIRILPILHIDCTANTNIEFSYAINSILKMNKKLKINFGFMGFYRIAIVKFWKKKNKFSFMYKPFTNK